MTSRQEVYQKLKQVQKSLRLTDGDTKLMAGSDAMLPEVKQNLKDLQLYEQVLSEAMQRGLPLQESDRKELDILQQVLHLQDEDVQEIHHRLSAQTSHSTEALSDGSVNPVFAQDTAIADRNAITDPNLDVIRPPSSAANQPLPSTVISRPPTGDYPNLPGIKGQIMKRVLEKDGTPNVLEQPSTDASGGLTAVSASVTPATVPAPTLVQPVTTVVQQPEIATPATPVVVEQPVKRPFYRRPEGILLLLLLAAMPLIWGLTWLLTRSHVQPVRSDPQAAQQAFAQGTQKAQQNDYQAAADDFSKAIQMDARNGSAYINRGVAYHRLGKLGQAADDLDKAIALNGQSAEAYSNRSYVRLDQKKYDEALKDGKRAAELNPNLAEAYLNIGAALFAQNKTDEAAQNYDKAIQLQPNNQTAARAYNNRGNVFASKNNLDQAIKDYDQATQFDSKCADAFYNRAIALERKKDTSAALRGYKDAAALYQSQGNDALRQQAQSAADRLERSIPSPTGSPAPEQRAI